MLTAPKKEVLTIGIFGSNGKTSTANLLSSIFHETGMLIEIINDKNFLTSQKNMTNNEIFKQLKSKENNDIIIVEINEDILKDRNIKDIDFDILIHSHIAEGSYESTEEGINNINSIINTSKRNRIVIINTDDSNWKRVVVDAENLCLITYGLGNKATVTASSIQTGKKIDFCYCLQRSVVGFTSILLEPMEIPVSIKTIGQYNIYNGLAAITAALVSGIEPGSIISSLDSAVLNTGLEILHENGFTVIYNPCNTVSSFDTGFESVQNFPYNNVYLIFNLNPRNTWSMNQRIIDVISTWGLILKIKKVSYLESNDYAFDVRSLNCLVTTLNNIVVGVEDMKASFEKIDMVINSLEKNDMLLLFYCGEDSNFKDQIVEILDKRILRGLSCMQLK